MEDELKAAIDEASRRVDRCIDPDYDLHPADEFLAKHGDTLLAAVRLAEFFTQPNGHGDPFDHLKAYRAAKEASDEI